jgi:ABC-type phosphate/phosphonate transport system ATPase subunit
MEADAIKECLKKDPLEWQPLIKIALEREQTVIAALDSTKVTEIYSEKTSKLKKDKVVTLDEIIECSKEVAKECSNYAHNLY